ncbi:MAG: TIM barrel protein [Eubacteriales bacterium]|nr:TIM barrel protein [Eubacteriales bacterium]
MKKCMNITTYEDDLNRYRDAADLAAFAAGYGLDGLEVMPGPVSVPYEFLPGQVVGVHMRCAYDWLDFWRGDREVLNREYGNEKTWSRVFGGHTKDALLRKGKADLAYARKTGAKYVVFHVSNIRTTDIFTYTFDYTDEDVLRASAEFVNELLDGEEPSFDFLMENLWWPGLRFNDADVTRRFLERIHYLKKGLMLDTGHFLHTNLELQNQEEAADYILHMLQVHQDLLDSIKGLHLHQSISSAYVKKLLQEKPDIPRDYEERFAKSMEHVFAIDSHEAFTSGRVGEIVDMVKPEYVTLEFLSASREEHAGKLQAQAEALGWIKSEKIS